MILGETVLQWVQREGYGAAPGRLDRKAPSTSFLIMSLRHVRGLLAGMVSRLDAMTV